MAACGKVGVVICGRIDLNELTLFPATLTKMAAMDSES